jgi:phospholipid/cholesterol/gamma-HCH transport system substrate-binding protein
MGRNLVETIMGAVVLVIAGLFMAFAFTSAQLDVVDGYQVRAQFDRVDGLNVGTDVRLSGIKVGTVIDLDLDPKSFLAVMTMSIDPQIRLPADSSARIVSEGLLGGKYVTVEPGGDETALIDGGEIEFTQSPIILEDLIGQLIYSTGGDSSEGSK